MNPSSINRCASASLNRSSDTTAVLPGLRSCRLAIFRPTPWHCTILDSLREPSPEGRACRLSCLLMRVARRNFLKAGLLVGAPPLSAAAQDLDTYGGWTQKRFRKTGHFRIDRDDRWWLVTPEGNGFRSFGANHIHGGWWKAPYNGDHWAREFGVRGPSAPEFNPRLRSEMMRLLPELGFNSIGVHSDLPVLNRPRPFIPYVGRFVIIDIPHWKTPSEQDFPDVFSKSFEDHAVRVARRDVAPLRDDPMLLGYAMTDWPDLHGLGCQGAG